MPQSDRRSRRSTAKVLALPAFEPGESVLLVPLREDPGADMGFARVLRVLTRPAAVVVSYCGIELAFSGNGRGRLVAGGYTLEKRNQDRERASLDRYAAPVVSITKR